MASVDRLLETALYVEDLERSTQFYQQVLGLELLEATAAERESWGRILRPLHVPGGQVLLLFAKGSTATNQNKDALLETGARVKVPPFVEIGEMIRVDTRTGEYLERVR